MIVHIACSLHQSWSSGFFPLLCLLIRLRIIIITILFVTCCHHVQTQDHAEPRIPLVHAKLTQQNFHAQVKHEEDAGGSGAIAY